MQNHTTDGTVEQRRSTLTTLALGLSTFLILFDVTAVVVDMPAIANDVGLGVAGLAWVIDDYSLAFTGALLASGARANRLSEHRPAGPCVRRHRCDLRCRHGIGADPRGLPGLVARLALDLFRKHPLLSGAGPGDRKS